MKINNPILVWLIINQFFVATYYFCQGAVKLGFIFILSAVYNIVLLLMPNG